MKMDEVHLSATGEKELNKIRTMVEMSKLIGEPEYAVRVVYWDAVCLDSTYHAYDTLSTILKIGEYRKLEEQHKGDSKKLRDEIEKIEKVKPRVIEKEEIERILHPFFF